MATAIMERKSTMNDTPSLANVFKNMISITDLNKGKSAKIIDDVKKTGFKVILKNNRPEAVLITPDQFEKMLAMREEIEDMTIGMEALRRLSNFNSAATISHENILAEFGISREELDSIDVEIG